MDPFVGTILILLAALLASAVTVVGMAFLGLDPNSIVSAIITFGLWVLFWRSEFLLPWALSGQWAYALIFNPWWLLFAILYATFFLLWFKLFFKRWF